MARDPDRAAQRLAAPQFGIVTWAQARHRAGLTQRQIEWRVATKRWRVLQPKVFAVDGAPQSWHQSLLAAQRRARTETVVTSGGRQRLQELDDAAVSGSSAVWLRGCRRLGQPREHELLVGRLRTPAVKGARVRRTRSLPPGDVDLVDHVPTLALPRLLVELSGQLEDLVFVAVLEDLLSRADEQVRDEAGENIGEVDAVWVGQRVVIELDGLRFHSSPQQRRRDNRKDRRLAAAGWTVLRYTWLDVMERPEELVAEVQQALGR